MMKELVDLVVKRTGISESQARKAIDTVLDFLKERLPTPLADRLDDIVEGANQVDLDKGLDMLGGLLGKK